MLGATLFGAGAIFASPQVASAKEVADGGLPPGIAEYMGVIKSKKQWNQIGKRVSEGKDEIPKSEWENIQVRALWRLRRSRVVLPCIQQAIRRKNGNPQYTEHCRVRRASCASSMTPARTWSR
jgi:hypothetical protein